MKPTKGGNPRPVWACTSANNFSEPSTKAKAKGARFHTTTNSLMPTLNNDDLEKNLAQRRKKREYDFTQLLMPALSDDDVEKIQCAKLQALSLLWLEMRGKGLVVSLVGLKRTTTSLSYSPNLET